MTELQDIHNILSLVDKFKQDYGYNLFDNYAYREILTVDYLKKYYPSMLKKGGRYGTDCTCSELNLNLIEIKSRKKPIRKKTQDYDIRSVKYQVDVSKGLEKILNSDAFVFSLFDEDIHSKIVHILFVHKPDNVKLIKELIIKKHNEFNNLHEDKKTHKHIALVYEEMELLGDQFGDYKPATNIMEFYK